MHSRPHEAGQTATEYLGILVIVAAIVAGIASTGLGATIAGEVRSAVCRIMGGECAPTGGGGGRDDGSVPIVNDVEGGGGSGTPTGPDFGDGEFPIADIPWTGAITLGDEPVGKGGLYVKASVTVSETECTLGPDGNPVVNLNVAGNFKSGFKAEGKLPGGLGGSADAYEGDGIAWNIATNPDTAEDIQDGSLPTPTPVDPSTIPAGTTLTLTESTYKGLNLGASYKGVQTSLGYQEGREVSSAVTRVDDDTVRVTVGDADFVEQAAGISLVGALKAGVSRRSTSAKAKQVDIDLSTKAGRQAYADFVQSGTLPSSGTGVSGTSDIDSYTTKDALNAGIKLPGFDASLASNQTVAATTVTAPDGSKKYTYYSGGQDVTRATTWSEDAEGNETGDHVAEIRYGGVSKGEADLLSSYYAGEGIGDVPDGDLDYTVRLTDADIAQLQEQAKVAAAQYEEDGFSNFEVEGLAEAPPGLVPSILQQTPEGAALLLADVRRGVALAEDWDRDDSREDFNALFPDVEPSVSEAGCS